MPDPRPPFRADHVGSLLRPPSLKALRLEKEAGRATAQALAAAEDAAIRDAVALQEGVGLQGITDGEMRRKSWHMDFLMQFSGLNSEGKALPVTFRGKSGEMFFTRPDLSALGVDPASVSWQHARVVLGVSDPRAIQNAASLRWNGVQVQFLPGTEALPAMSTGRPGDMRKNRSTRSGPRPGVGSASSESNLMLPVTVTFDGSAPSCSSRLAVSSPCTQKRSTSASTRLKNGRISW